MQIHQVWPSRSGLLYEVSQDGDVVVDVEIDGRRVWSFRHDSVEVPAELVPEGISRDRLRFQEWPAVLVPRLRGTYDVRLRPSGSEEGAGSTVHQDGSPGGPALTDLHGRPLVVNKWGRLNRAIADADPGMVDRMLVHMDEIRVLLEEQLGPVVFVTCGTLLGPVRENGRLLPHDDDADLGYLSGHSHPADVALESFEVGRMLRSAGYEVVRLSVGHLQVQFAHHGVPDHYVDVFPGFMLDGYWLQYFPIRVEASRDELLPTTTVMVEGRPEPAPHRPEFTLTTLYGEGWRKPDPSFTFDLPASTSDRFYGWFADYNVEREDWDEVILLPRPDDASGDDRISAFSRWVHDRTPAQDALLELGCGTGTDALALGELGRSVRALDFSRYAVATARSRAAGREPGVSFDVLNLLDTRQVIRLGAELASGPASWTVLGRRLLNALEDRGRANVFRLCSMLLRGPDGSAGAAYFDVVDDDAYPGIAPHRHLTVQQIATEAAVHGLVLEEAETRLEPLRWFGEVEEHVVPLHRMTFRRRPR
jgi:SAM-dependent methyltransferase